ncbi:hypothetical protein FDECE_9487 [Fusarium decemcellulare]|nr:hypothetical protein FDECE_9487 [Fusarium decemcellulare]
MDTLPNAERHSTNADGPSPKPSPLEEVYARAVNSHASRSKETSIYPGENYRRLASFLSRPYDWGRASFQGGRDKIGTAFPFAIVYQKLGEGSILSPRKDSLRPAEFQRSCFGSDDQGLQDFRPTTSSPADILFLQGAASPEWLNVIGARYGIDPEFFRRHIDMQFAPLYFDLPALQSSSLDMVAVPLISIGKWGVTMPSHMDINTERRESRTSNRPMVRLVNNQPVCASTVRQYLVLSQNYFAVEQIASVYMHTKKNGNWVAVVWSDCGRDLAHDMTTSKQWRDPCSSFHQSNSSILPVFQYQRKAFVKQMQNDESIPATDSGFLHLSQHHSQPHASFETHSGHSKMAQSARLIPWSFGQDLDTKTLQQDGVYAISDLLSFAACSESQFLNLIEHLIDEDGNVESAPYSEAATDTRTTSNLEFNKRVLEARLKMLQTTHTCIAAGGGPSWPRAKEEQQREIADAMRSKLERDYQELIERAQGLIKRCMEDSLLLMNKTMIRDTQRGVVQAEAMARLTLLAYFFIPLSFTATFLGMNVKELDANSLSIWVWFAITAPVMGLSLCLYFEEHLRRGIALMKGKR